VFLPKSSLLVSASEDKILKVWDTTTGKENLTVRDQGPSNEVPS